MRKAAVWFLVMQGGAALLWWSVLLVWPATRRLFVFPGAPQSVLLAFLGPDLLLFTGASWIAAWGLKKSASWAWGMLCLHVGAVSYATLLCWSLALSQGGGWAGVLLMTLSTGLLLVFVWRLRPTTGQLNDDDSA